jgi:hypothetical protein
MITWNGTPIILFLFSLSKKKKEKERKIISCYLFILRWVVVQFFWVGFLNFLLAPPTLGVGEEEDERRLFTRLSICRRPGPPFLF